MKTISDADQVARMARSDLAVLRLIKLTTYTDKDAGTAGTIFYISDRAVIYDYANTGTDQTFVPWLDSLGESREAMTYMPGGAGSGITEKTLTLDLHNSEFGGLRVAAILAAATGPIEGARIEVVELLVDTITAAPIDLTALTGDEHTLRFMGVVGRPLINNTTITLECVTEKPNIDWYTALDATITDPKDVGLRFPILYGQLELVPLISYDVGFATTLAEKITAAATGTVEVTDTTGFAAAGSAMIGAESIAWSGKTATTLTGVTRAQDSTTAAAHAAGALITEVIATAVFVVSDHAVDAIGDVSALNPFSGEVARVTTAFTKTISDAATIGGKTIATISFTAAQMRAAIVEMAEASQVSTQPEFSIDDSNLIELTPPTRGTREWDNGIGDPFAGTVGAVSDTVSRLDKEQGVGADADELAFWWPAGSMPGGTRVVSRWRVRATYNYLADRDFDADIIGINFPGTDPSISDTLTSDTTVIGHVSVTPWRTPPGGTALDDLEGGTVSSGPRIRIRVDPSDAWNNVEFLAVASGGVVLEAEVEPSALTRDTNVGIEAASIGFGLRLFADVDGAVAPAASPAYAAGTGNLIEHPADVARHWLEVVGGQAMDTTTLATAVTNLGSNKLAGDARGFGTTFLEVLDHLARISRANFVPSEITTAGVASIVWKMFTAESDYTWGASVRTLTLFEDNDVFEGGRAESLDLFSQRTFLYQYEPNRSGGDEAFAKVLRIGDDQNDSGGQVAAGTVTAAIAAMGKLDAPVAFLLGIRDTTTAQEITGWIYTEGARVGARIVGVRNLSWSDGFDLEVGDISAITLPWAAGLKTIRLIEVTKDYRTQRVGVQGVIVP